jgi:hypothetical protein
MTQDEIIEMAFAAGFVEYEIDDGTTNAFDKRYESFAKLVAAKAIAELESQEPVAKLKTSNVLLRCHSCGYSDKLTMQIEYTHPPQRTEQNFCSRCGKRTKDSTHIHTCTPPQD